MKTLGKLLLIGGKIAITLREGFLDDERIMYEVDEKEIVSQAYENNLALITGTSIADKLARKNVSWKYFIFQKI